MALPPAIAPAPSPNQHNPAQEYVQDPNPRDHQVTSSHSPAPSREYDQSLMHRSSPSSPREYNSLNNLDPAIGGVMSTGNDSGGDDNSGDGRKGIGKRELSTSKRAAQNRAAQRAFRQRKEGYIKKLEEQVRDYALMNENYKAVQAENYQLRDYIINLQSRLIESQGDFPQPPPNVDLPHPSRRQNHDRHESTIPVSAAPPPPPSVAASRPTHLDFSAPSSLRTSASQINPELGLGIPSKHANEDPYGQDHLTKRFKNDSSDPATAAQDALQGGGMTIEPRISNSPQSRDLTIGSVLNRSNTEVATSRPMLSA